MFDYPSHIRPATGVELGRPIDDLSAGEALAELHAALDGWLDEVLTARTGFVFDPDREHAGQIGLSLYRAVALLRDEQYAADDQDRERDALRAAVILENAARCAEHGAKTALLAGAETVKSSEVTRPQSSHDDASAYVRAFYRAAVAGVRQAHDVLVHGTEFVSAVATTTRCAGGSLLGRCSHGRSEDHHLVETAGTCEAAAELCEATPCDQTPADAVLVRDRVLGPIIRPRLADGPDDVRGIRGCVRHGARLLAYTYRATVHPGPGDAADTYALDAFNAARTVPAGRVPAERFRTSPAAVPAEEAGR